MGSLLHRRDDGDGAFEIIDLPPRHERSYLVCLEDWSEEMKEAGDHKAQWYAGAKQLGLRVKLAVDPDDQPIGMIQYLPIEHSAPAASPRGGFPFPSG